MKKSKIACLFTAFALAFTTVIPGAGVTGVSSVMTVEAAGTVTVKSQLDLDNALTNRAAKKIVIKSDAGKLTIKKGNYSAVKLEVSSSRTKVVNAGSFSKITIVNASSFVEKAAGNSFSITDTKLKLNVKKKAKNTVISVDKENAAIDIVNAGSISSISATKSGCKVNVTGAGSVAETKAEGTSEILINGNKPGSDSGSGSGSDSGSGSGSDSGSGSGSDSGSGSGSDSGSGSGSDSGSGSSSATPTAGGVRFANNLMKWYLVDTSTESFNITPDSDDMQVVFFVKSKSGKAIKYDELEVLSSNENVATVSWDQMAAGKYYILKVCPGGMTGKSNITVKAIEYKGNESVTSEYKFDVTSRDFNNNMYDVEFATSSVKLYNSPYAPVSDVKVKAVNSLGEAVTADWEVNVYSKGEETDEVRAEYVQKGAEEYIRIDALGAQAGTYSVEVIVTGDSGNNTKEKKKNISVQVTDVVKSVYPDGWYVSGKEIVTKGSVAKDISATYKIETEDLYITDYKGSKLVSEVKLAVYISGKPLGYMDTSGVQGFDKGWEIGAKALLKSGAFAGDWGKANFDLLNAYVYSGSNYYNNVKDGTLYLGQMQKSEYTTKDKIDNTIKAGSMVSLFSRSSKSVNEIMFYGNSSNKNNIAAAGRYNVVIKYGSFSDGKQLGNTGSINVSYDLTMPNVTYNSSEQAEVYVEADVDIARAEDGYSVSYCANNGSTNVRYPDYTFGKGGLSKNDKIYAVMVDDVRGGNLNDGAENANPGWLSAYPGAEDMKNKYSFDGGLYEEGILIHFILEKTVRITA